VKCAIIYIKDEGIMTRREEFKQYFVDKQIVTTTQIEVWYESVKEGRKNAYPSNVYDLIIKPLLLTGELERLGKGMYRFNREEVMQGNEEDEWEKYVTNKMKGV